MEQHDSVSVKEKGEEEPGSVLDEDVKQAKIVTEQIEAKDDRKEAEITINLGEVEQQDVQENESVETITDQPVRDLERIFEDDKHLQEDLERLRVCLHCVNEYEAKFAILKALQQELVGETDDEVEKFKCRLIEEMPLTDSQEEGSKITFYSNKK